MKDIPLSNCEKQFVQQAIQEKQRLDGRRLNDFRDIKINFGSELGNVLVSLGETKVLAQVSCELTLPKATRPTEGLLYINVELSFMGLGSSKNSELTVKTIRMLERTIKDSRCVDLESLCVSAEDKVWALRVDLVVINHEGNIIDCASVAALCALAHFKRPDVSIYGDEIKIHSSAEKDLIPIVLHHYPVCVSFATFNNGEIAVADPTEIEERVSEADIILGLNSYKELCSLNLGGKSLTSTDLLMKCANCAATRAKSIVDLIKDAIKNDAKARDEGKVVGFSECVRLQQISSSLQEKLTLRLPEFSFDYKIESKEEEKENNIIEPLAKEGAAMIDSNQENIKWIPEESSDENSRESESEEDKDIEEELEELQNEAGKFVKKPIHDEEMVEENDLSNDS